MSPRSATLSAALSYLVKVWMAGLGAALFVPLAVAAAALDVLSGAAPEKGLLDGVLGTSARLEAWIDVHGAKTHITVAD